MYTIIEIKIIIVYNSTPVFIVNHKLFFHKILVHTIEDILSKLKYSLSLGLENKYLFNKQPKTSILIYLRQFSKIMGALPEGRSNYF